MFLFPFGFLSRSKTNTIRRAAPQRRTAMWNKNIEGKKLRHFHTAVSFRGSDRYLRTTTRKFLATRKNCWWEFSSIFSSP